MKIEWTSDRRREVASVSSEELSQEFGDKRIISTAII